MFCILLAPFWVVGGDTKTQLIAIVQACSLLSELMDGLKTRHWDV